MADYEMKAFWSGTAALVIFLVMLLLPTFLEMRFW